MPTPTLPEQDEASFSSCVLKASVFSRFKAAAYCTVGGESALCSVQSLVLITSSSVYSLDSDKVP